MKNQKDFIKKAISNKNLDFRLYFNKKYQNKDIHKWYQKNVIVRPSFDILDVGCGTGMLLKNISCRNKVGIDFSPRQIENVDPSIDANFLCGDFLNIELNRKFDKVICFGVLFWGEVVAISFDEDRQGVK